MFTKKNQAEFDYISCLIPSFTDTNIHTEVPVLDWRTRLFQRVLKRHRCSREFWRTGKEGGHEFAPEGIDCQNGARKGLDYLNNYCTGRWQQRYSLIDPSIIWLVRISWSSKKLTPKFVSPLCYSADTSPTGPGRQSVIPRGGSWQTFFQNIWGTNFWAHIVIYHT